MPSQDFFDLIVLGAGSGGLAAAKRAASYGARVAVIEGDRVGGTCVIRGCVPKKLLVYGSLYREHIEASGSFGIDIGNVSVDSKTLLSNVRKEVDRLNSRHTDLLKDAGVELIIGWGSFISQNCVLVRDNLSDNNGRKIFAENILIAVGSQPHKPEVSGAELGWVSDDMFNLETFPENIIVVGGGFIACEFASILNGLGVNVTLIVRGEKLLRGFDEEISSELQERMQKKGIQLLLNQTIRLIEGSVGELTISIDNGIKHNSDGVLFATGRKPLLSHLGLELASIKLESNKIPVDINQATNIKNIFAVGDVTNNINLTPVAIEEGRAFADRIFGSKPRYPDYNNVPRAVFSNPEIATVGLTEKQAIDRYGLNQTEIYRAKFKSMQMAFSRLENRCLLKLVVIKSSQKVVGCHMIGEYSAEIIQMAAIALQMGARKSDFDQTMALHPTIAEEFVTMS